MLFLNNCCLIIIFIIYLAEGDPKFVAGVVGGRCGRVGH